MAPALCKYPNKPEHVPSLTDALTTGTACKAQAAICTPRKPDEIVLLISSFLCCSRDNA